MGGIGKSVLAAAIAHEKAIQKHFSDGILWVTLGQKPDILPMLGRWNYALGDRDFRPTTTDAASTYLRTLLYDKKALLVVDDVWKPEHLDPFRVGGSDCCVMVTTREAKILDAKRYDLDVFTASQSMELLTQKLTEPLSDSDIEKAKTFADRVGHLPLAIELAAAQIEDGLTWSELLEDFFSEVARLESLDALGQEEMSDEEKRRKYSLIASYNLSLRQMTPEQLKQFAWMGVLPEDVSVSQEMTSTLWQVTPRQAGTALRQLRSKALILSGAKEEGNRATYRMHDLMHDVAQRLLAQSPHPQGGNELPGLGMTKAEAHAALLERYRAKTESGQWHTLPDDGYIYAYLTWLMEQAACPDMVHQLLQETTTAGRNGWYVRCDELIKPSLFVNDVARAWQLATNGLKQNPLKALCLLWRYTLIRGSINSLASNVPAKLVGALVAKRVWQPAQGLAYAQQTQNPWDRAECLTELVPHIPESLLPEMTSAVEQIIAPAYRSFVMGQLAQQFPQLWSDALNAICEIQDCYGADRHQVKGFSYRARALSALAEHLPPELLPKALAVTRQIQAESYRSRALIEIAQHLPELWPEALAVTRQIQAESY
ncbi:MAG: NB-ARC domain-containing protein, partial [Elainellaceae cyanobacterium]